MAPRAGLFDGGFDKKSIFDPEVNSDGVFDPQFSQTTAGGHNGTLAVTLGALTLSATGTVEVQGTLTTTLGALTLSATGTVDVQGTASITLGDVTLAGAGTVASAGPQGTLDVTLDALTLAGTGTVEVKGTASITLGALTLAGTGGVEVHGTLAVTLGTLTLAGTGGVEVQGTLAVTLGSLSLLGIGIEGDQAPPPPATGERHALSGWEHGDEFVGSNGNGLTFGSNVIAPSRGGARAYASGATNLSYTPSGSVRAGYVQFRFKIERLPSNGDGNVLIHEMRNGATNPSGQPQIVLTSSGTLQFWNTGLTPVTDGTLMFTSAALSVGDWHLIEYRTVMNTATQTGTPGTETNASLSAWVNGVALGTYAPGGSITPAVGIHVTTGFFQSIRLCNSTATGLASATNAIICFDDYILDETVRCNDEHIVGLKPNGFGTYNTGWTNPARAMTGNVGQTGAATSTTANARVSYTVPTLRSRGCHGASIGPARLLILNGSVTGSTAGLFLMINGVETFNTVNLAGTSLPIIPKSSEFDVTIYPDDQVEVGFQKDNSVTSRNFSALCLCVAVADADVDIEDPSEDVETAFLQYTGDGTAHQVVALPFEPDLIYLVPVDGTTNYHPHVWESSSRQGINNMLSTLQSAQALMVMEGHAEMIVTDAWGTGLLNTTGLLYDVFAIRDPSRRTIQLGDFTRDTGEDNFDVALEDATFPIDFLQLTNQSVASTGNAQIHGLASLGDNTYRFGTNTGGGITDAIQSVGTGTFEIGADTNIQAAYFNPYFALSIQRFTQTTLMDVVSWTGDGTTPRVIPTNESIGTVQLVLVFPTETGASANGRRAHIRSPGFTSTNSRMVGTSAGAVVTTGIVALGTDQFSVGVDCNLSGQDYQALVIAEGIDLNLVPVPDVVGLTVAAAITALEAGLVTLGTVSGGSDAQLIVDQDPDAGTLVVIGTPVNVVLAGTGDPCVMYTQDWAAGNSLFTSMASYEQATDGVDPLYPETQTAVDVTVTGGKLDWNGVDDDYQSAGLDIGLLGTLEGGGIGSYSGPGWWDGTVGYVLCTYTPNALALAGSSYSPLVTLYTTAISALTLAYRPPQRLLRNLVPDGAGHPERVLRAGRAPGRGRADHVPPQLAVWDLQRGNG